MNAVKNMDQRTFNQFRGISVLVGASFVWVVTTACRYSDETCKYQDNLAEGDEI